MRRGGTKVSSGPNLRRWGEAMSVPGIDPRRWVEEGIVATVSEDGVVNDGDENATIVAVEGREVDVVLLPDLTHHLTCRFPSGGANSTDDWPLHPGDHVLVVLPGGGASGQGVILAVMNSAADPLPAEGGFPMFRNDRRLIWANNIPIDLRTGTARLTLQEGQQLLGGPDAAEQLVLGTSYRPAEKNVMDLLDKLMTAVNTAIVAATGPSVPQKEAVTAAQVALSAAIGGFNAQDYLSSTSKTK